MSTTSPATSLPMAGRVAIVTGASRGIGRAIALHLASLGANLVINYATNSTQADLLASEINSTDSNLSSSRAVTVQADVSDPSAAKLLFDRAEQFFGSPVHILINNAAILDSKHPTIASTALEDFDATFNVNARGVFLCCREAANRVVRGGGGRIINISTSLVAGPLPGYGAYTASKAAVEAMTRILAKELKGTAITANCVAPGPTATDMFFAGTSEEFVKKIIDAIPMGRLGETKDVAPVAGFLCRDEAEWINGQVVRVSGGLV